MKRMIGILSVAAALAVLLAAILTPATSRAASER